MKAVFKREFKSYFTTGIGFIYIALYLIAQGIIFRYLGLKLGCPNFNLTLINGIQYMQMLTYAALLIPLLSLKQILSNRDGVLLSLPVSPAKIVLGKYLAEVAVFSIPVVFSLALPAVYTFYTEEKLNLISDYASIFAYWMLGCALIALCTFISSIPFKKWIRILAEFAAIAILYLADTFSFAFTSKAFESLLLILIFEALAVLLIWVISRKLSAAAIAAGVLAVPTLALFFIAQDGFTGLFCRITQKVGLFSRLGNNFVLSDIFDIATLLLYVAFAAFFIFLTVRNLRNLQVPENAGSKPSFKTVSLLLAAAIFAGFCAAGFAVGAIPMHLRAFDLSQENCTYVAPETLESIGKSDTEVTIYLLADLGITDAQIDLQLSKIQSAGKNIRIVTVNTASNPDFARDYTESDLGDYSIIVKSKYRSTVVDSMAFFDYRYSSDTSSDVFMSYDEFISVYSKLYSAFASGYSYYGNESDADSYCQSTYGIKFTDFNNNTDKYSFRTCAEPIAQAIAYVSAPDIPLLYTVTGHGESDLSETLEKNFILASGYDLGGSLDLSAADIPANASALLILAPQTDLSAAEAEKVGTYLSNGGSVILTTSPDCIVSQQNILSVTKQFGLGAVGGTLCDLGDSRYYQAVKNLIPVLNSEGGIGKTLSDAGCTILAPNCHAIILDANLPSGVTVSTIAMTSENAYRVLNNQKLAGSDGMYRIAAIAKNQSEGKIVWFSSADCFTDSSNEITSSSNYYAFLFALTSVADYFDPGIDAVYTKTQNELILSASNTQAAGWLVIIAVALPLIMIASGFAVVYKRSRKH